MAPTQFPLFSDDIADIFCSESVVPLVLKKRHYVLLMTPAMTLESWWPCYLFGLSFFIFPDVSCS